MYCSNVRCHHMSRFYLMFYLSLYYSIFYPFMIFKATYRPVHGSGRVGSILDPTWNQSTNVRWKVEGLEKPIIDINWSSRFQVRVKATGTCKNRRNLQKFI